MPIRVMISHWSTSSSLLTGLASGPSTRNELSDLTESCANTVSFTYTRPLLELRWLVQGCSICTFPEMRTQGFHPDKCGAVSIMTRCFYIQDHFHHQRPHQHQHQHPCRTDSSKQAPHPATKTALQQCLPSVVLTRHRLQFPQPCLCQHVPPVR